MTTILIASGNAHKLDEIRAVLGGLGVGCIGLDEAGNTPAEPDEDGHDFATNARTKAVVYAKAMGRVCLADDSGLEIDALGGRPGVRSARYFNDGAPTDLPRAERDRLNNERVLGELEGVADEDRGARFVCALCLADAQGRVLVEVCGTFEGRIGSPPRVPSGGNGFGYDPLFLVAPDFERTSAELTPEEKNRLSHRGSALRALVEHLRRHPI